MITIGYPGCALPKTEPVGDALQSTFLQPTDDDDDNKDDNDEFALARESPCSN